LGGFAFAEGPNSFALGSCTASGRYARALGTSCEASGEAATAMGNNARAAHRGSFVWADSQNPSFSSTADNQFLIRAAGGVGINTANPGAMLQVGDADLSGSQGMIRLASRSGAGPQTRHWDIGVPQGGSDVSGKFYSFVIDDPRLGTQPEVVVRWDTGNVGIGTTSPVSRVHAVASAGHGVQGNSSDTGASGVYGENLSGAGYGVAGRATGIGSGVFGENANPSGWAGYFNGNVRVTGTLNPPSDRNVKHGFATVDSREVLEKVAALSIQTWAYTNDTRGTRHLGPVAQDFQAAFGLGADDKTIATVDADGVALAAIQGLNQKVEEQRAALEQKETEITKLKGEMAELKRLVGSLTQEFKSSKGEP
jgi:hypothetical protein